MLAFRSSGLCVVLVAFSACVVRPVFAQSLQLVSTVNPEQGSPVGGSGDSWAPLVSPDGRYVLFASTANNLLVTTSNAPMPGGFPPSLNVFLRNRAKGTTSLISVDSTGLGGGNGDSLPMALSTNGRYALFESRASNLVPVLIDGNNGSDIFVRDLVANVTLLVSANTNGQFANGPSREAVMTPDGRYVAFASEASDLVSGDTNGIADIFVRDLQAGTTALVSVGAMSTNATLPVGGSAAPDITPDGRYVVFCSTATNLVPGGQMLGDVYVRDLITATTTWASSGASAAVTAVFGPTSVVSFNHAISADGKYVAYEASPPRTNTGVLLRYNLATASTDTVFTNAAVPVAAGYQFIRSLELTPDGRFIAFIGNAGVSSNTPVTTCVYVWEAASGNLTLASGDLNGTVPTNSTCDWPAIDDAGRRVAFLSTAPRLVTNLTVGDYHVYVRDLQAKSTTLIDADTNGVGSPVSPATAPSLSEDGRFVAFDCEDGKLVGGDLNRDSDVFISELSSSITELVSAHDPALGSATPNGPSLLTTASISSGGRFVAFASEASNLVPGDTNDCRDIFLRDMESGSTTLVSVATNGSFADGYSWEPAVSADGRYVAFTSMADNLVAGDTNQDQDVFVRDLVSKTTILVSVSTNGAGSGNKPSYSPIPSSIGRYVLFRSRATNLAPGTGSQENLFFRDMQASTNVGLTTQGVGPAAMSSDGHFVLYNASSQTRLYNSLVSTSAVYVSLPLLSFTDLGYAELLISPNEQEIALSSGTSGKIWTTQLTNLNSPVQPIVAVSQPVSHPRWDADGRYLIYRTARATSSQIWLHDFSLNVDTLVTHAFDSPAVAASGASDYAEISLDGRFVAYRSTSTNLSPGLLTGRPAIYLYDVQTGTNTPLVQASGMTPTAADRFSSPVFSDDSRTLYFASWAPDLTPQDFNHNSDLFAYSFFYATVLPSSSPASGALLVWPSSPGKNYRVQFKDGLNDTTWHDLAGTISTNGNRASLQDPAAPASQRLYRIVGF